jgi:cysteinyl-tRNA synthetase
MYEDGKTLKQYCKEAMKRMKKGFWQDYYKNLAKDIEKANQEGYSAEKVKQAYITRFNENVKINNAEREEFYQRVKALLDECGEVSNAIGRLTDKDYYQTLSYEEQQRYNLELSEKYLKAVERYKREKVLQQ